MIAAVGAGSLPSFGGLADCLARGRGKRVGVIVGQPDGSRLLEGIAAGILDVAGIGRPLRRADLDGLDSG